ncbi:NADH dehydrogenase [Mannheimia haemolytica]|uniref:NADH dehydrogenase n=1 Tax=Mannheimia haemolytica TaxID=75985 RepID=A0A378MYV7_MANHA|nr:NADH dehydrogenase [Mannheimia haemolytica]
MMELFLRFSHSENKDVKIAIVGGGATGIELSAELYHVVKNLNSYGFGKLNRASLKVTLIEAGPRLIPALPEKVSVSAFTN